jgi:hypothetical protein
VPFFFAKNGDFARLKPLNQSKFYPPHYCNKFDEKKLPSFEGVTKGAWKQAFFCPTKTIFLMKEKNYFLNLLTGRRSQTLFYLFRGKSLTKQS